MIKARGVVFGDGLTELIPEDTEEKVIYLDEKKEKTGSQKTEKRHFKDDIRGKSANRSAKMSIHDGLIILSVVMPFVFGFLWATVLVRHEVVYVIYWHLTFAWMALVLYANRGKRKCRREK